MPSNTAHQFIGAPGRLLCSSLIGGVGRVQLWTAHSGAHPACEARSRSVMSPLCFASRAHWDLNQERFFFSLLRDA
jgi:hypothetical protein